MKQRSLPSGSSQSALTVAMKMEAWAAAVDSVGSYKRLSLPGISECELFGMKISVDLIRVRISS